jgi:hypothetical protein
MHADSIALAISITELETEKACLTIDKIHRTRFDVMFDSDFDERDARISRADRYLDCNLVAVCGR